MAELIRIKFGREVNGISGMELFCLFKRASLWYQLGVNRVQLNIVLA